ncbi:hypothetical protein KOW79_019250 [Hemibagrus wyckioides]|uniref:Uncharacterized protein n=1 Tax=Hemibagrus wyckioides TaxID=337641 RepID=A0A9D3N9S5_9TELE|nr:hypothetical protein KOW79_019250 [Hemibagrus wyckioides]
MTQHAMKGSYISMRKKDILFPEIFLRVNTYSSVRYSGLYPPPFRLPDIKCTTSRDDRHGSLLKSRDISGISPDLAKRGCTSFPRRRRRLGGGSRDG